MLRSPKTSLMFLIFLSISLLYIHLSKLRDEQETLDHSSHSPQMLIRTGSNVPNLAHVTRSGSAISPALRMTPYPKCDEECRQVARLNRRIDCRAIIEGDPKALSSAERYLDEHPKLAAPERVLRPTGCRPYRTNPFYRRTANSPDEERFPIAYSIVAHRKPAQLERLVRAIYWPQNVYCVHVDRKADSNLAQFVANLVTCLPNVIMAEREVVVYGGYTRLKADLNCMSALLRHSARWRYVINLTGEEYPLKTNRELVEILRIYNGSNDVEGTSTQVTNMFSSRYVNRWRVDRLRGVMKMVRGSHHPPPPDNITLVKGSTFGVFSRPFVEFVLTDSTVTRFLAWLEDVWSPDELFWSTLNSGYRNPGLGAPGSYGPPPESKLWLAKYVSWSPKDPCRGRRVRGICVFSSADLALLVARKELFANKFYIERDYVALHCLEQWIHNRTSVQSDGQMTGFDYQFYKQMSHVRSGE
ncbi:hypothetical protein LSH36_814g03051 [Paralvinella palmiformis]|uniref:Beta-1,3-galactosyl-O-glycosyl-glycoprotein beta-1,6-N-acetylglucosaminyltransferase n=1 Tax=Paralvinella palmiformis TaxID=53620 RepID=A0AAD9IZV0_9ANNE|nr:hypothetical protein LSH36_814g03051 [Paralvinella palmiformis]